MGKPQAKFVCIAFKNPETGQWVLKKKLQVQQFDGCQFVEHNGRRYQLPERYCQWRVCGYDAFVEIEFGAASDFYCDLAGDQKLQIWCCASNNWGQSDLAPYPLTPHEARQYCQNCYWGASFYCAAFPYSPYSSNIGGDWLRAIHGKERLNSTHWLEENDG